MLSTWFKSRQKWRANIKHNSKLQFLGAFTTEKDAALAYDAAARRLRGAAATLNFPGRGEAKAEKQRQLSKIRTKARRSKYTGVSWARVSQKWTAYIKHNSKQQFLGAFTTEKDAALAYDAAARRLRGAAATLNFPV